MCETKTSRLPGFYQKPLQVRRRLLAEVAGLDRASLAALTGEAGLAPEQADHMVENVVGLYCLPLGVAANFIVNGREVLVPMAVEEPSVVAGASNAARLVRAGGGFHAEADDPVMIAQIQLLSVPRPDLARERLMLHRDRLLEMANRLHPSIVARGGGARDLQVRWLPETPIGPMMVVHLLFDTRDAMGANTVNTAAEALAPEIERITGGRVGLRILSNLAERRLARARCRVPLGELAVGDLTGREVRDRVVEAWAFAAADPYRAATHNKGILNGVDAVVVATGNDWRAVEAGAHAYAARSGRYTSLSRWGVDESGDLVGELEMPLAVGMVGGATRAHPTARACLALMGVGTARELAEIIVSVGLAQNLAALRALATEGIQRGHMRLHARQVAVAAGARDEEVEQVAGQMVAEGQVRPERAAEILRQRRAEQAETAVED